MFARPLCRCAYTGSSVVVINKNIDFKSVHDVFLANYLFCFVP